jgi:hypothetical protein
MSTTTIRTLVAGFFVVLVLQSGLAWSGHETVTLKGYDGMELTIDSKEPYSPKQTCGECHDYDEITNGYHFQQGRTNGSGKIVMSDTFNRKKPWIKSDGMFGKW